MAKKKASGTRRSVPDTGPAVVAVDLSTLRLSDEGKARVGEQLTRSVLDELASTDLGGARTGPSPLIVGRLRQDWYGGIRVDAIKTGLRQELLKELAGGIQPAGVVPDTSPAVSSVNLSALKLSSDSKARIGAQLSRTVLDELAKTDNKALTRGARGESNVAIVGQLRKDWYGAIRLDSIRPELQKQLAVEIQNTLEKLGPR